MEDCKKVKLTEKEWRFIQFAESSFSLREISEKSDLPYTTVYRIYSRLKNRADFRFVPDYKKMNLVNMILLFNGYAEIEKVHSFTLSIRKIYGSKTYIMVSSLLPYNFIKRYIDTFGYEPIVTVIGNEFKVWRSNSGFSFYLNENKTIIPVFNIFAENHKELYKEVDASDYSDRSPDYIDLAIIMRKRNHPFEPILKGIRWIRKNDHSFPILSKQLLSYHYNNHVKNYWLHNSVLLLNDYKTVPFRVFYFEGRDAPIVARILVNIPSFYTALIDHNKSLVIGQPQGYMFENIYRIVSMYDIDMPLGDLILSMESMGRYIPKLWHFVEKNRWVWREEMIKVINKYVR